MKFRAGVRDANDLRLALEAQQLFGKLTRKGMRPFRLRLNRLLAEKDGSLRLYLALYAAGEFLEPLRWAGCGVEVEVPGAANRQGGP